MATDKTPATTDDSQVLETRPDWNSVQWDTVAQEAGTRIVFDTIGDSFIGRYNGYRTVETADGENFKVLTWTGTDGEPYETNAGYSLEQAFEDLAPGVITRVTYVKDVPTGQASPMKSFRVEVANPGK